MAGRTARYGRPLHRQHRYTFGLRRDRDDSQRERYEAGQTLGHGSSGTAITPPNPHSAHGSRSSLPQHSDEEPDFGAFSRSLAGNNNRPTRHIRRRGAAVKNLAHSAYHNSDSKFAPSNPGIKQPTRPSRRAEMQAAREAWFEDQPDLDPVRLVLIDDIRTVTTSGYAG